MIRKIIYGVWLIAIVLSAGFLISTGTYQIQTYYASQFFEFELTGVVLTRNATSGDFLQLRVNATLWNPSSLISIEFGNVDTRVFLNGEELVYTRGRKGPGETLIPPLGTLEFGWSYYIDEAADELILQNADSLGSWEWFYWLNIYQRISFLGGDLYDRSQTFSGIIILEI